MDRFVSEYSGGLISIGMWIIVANLLEIKADLWLGVFSLCAGAVLSLGYGIWKAVKHG